jgi:hypothetical protein
VTTILGILGLIVFVASVIVLAAAVTWSVIRLTPLKEREPET